MFLTLVCASVAAAAPQPIKLASSTFKAVNVDQAEATFYADHLAQQLGQQGLQVVTQTEIQAVLGIEKQKQLMGCAEDASNCIAELGDALGADGIITGSVGAFAGALQLNVKILSPRTGRTLSAHSAQVASGKELLEELNRAAGLLATTLASALGRPLLTPSGPPLRRYAWLPLAGAAAFSVAGGYSLVQSTSYLDNLRNGGTLGASTLDDYVNAGKTYTHASAWCFAAAGASALGAVVMYFLGGTGPTTLSFQPSQRTGAAIVLEWE